MTQSVIYVALLRGINVGGKNRLTKAQQHDCLINCGAQKALVYIQSGNIVFSAEESSAKRLEQAITNYLLEQHQMQIPCIVLGMEKYQRILNNIPFAEEQYAEKALSIGFLQEEVKQEALDQVDLSRSPGDSLELSFEAVYFYCPGGFGKTKFTNKYLESKLGTACTVRNLKTSKKLVELAQEL